MAIDIKQVTGVTRALTMVTLKIALQELPVEVKAKMVVLAAEAAAQAIMELR